jgi:hypothetical protein
MPTEFAPRHQPEDVLLDFEDPLGLDWRAFG